MAMGILGYLCKDTKKSFIVRTVYGIILLIISTLLIVLFANSKAANWTPVGTEVFVYESHMPFLLSTFISFCVVQIGLMILAIKYMLGSVEEKAQYKKTMFPYVIGCVLIFGITNILAIIIDMVSKAMN